MTVKEFIKKHKLNPRNCCIEYADGSCPRGFIYKTDAEYRKLFMREYGEMEVENAYFKKGLDIIIVKR